jgi:hypothetical protein
MRGTLAVVAGTILCLGAIGAWFVTAPAVGSGWILFVAFLGSLWLFDAIGKSDLATIAGAAMTAASGAAWWFHSSLINSGWMLFLCILCGLGTFQALSRTVSKETSKKSRKDRDDE